MSNFLENVKDKKAFKILEEDVQEGILSELILESADKIYNRTINDIIKLGIDAQEKEYITILEGYIKGFNELDEKFMFIDTMLRDEILDVLHDIMDELEIKSITHSDDFPNVIREF